MATAQCGADRWGVFVRKLAAVAWMLGVALAARAQPHTLDEVVSTRLDDLSATASMTITNNAALQSISKDLGMLFALKSITIQYREPGMFRADNKIGSLIMNGSVMFYTVPQLRLKKRTDMGATVSRRYSLLDLGIVTRSACPSLDARYLRDEHVDGYQTWVFEAKFREEKPAKYMLWVDPVRRIVLKREWYGADGALLGTFLHRDAREVAPGVWAPLRTEIVAADGRSAAMATYSDIKANTGVAAALFDVPAAK